MLKEQVGRWKLNRSYWSWKWSVGFFLLVCSCLYLSERSEFRMTMIAWCRSIYLIWCELDEFRIEYRILGGFFVVDV